MVQQFCGAEGVMKTTLFGTPRMPEDPTKPDPPDPPVPASMPTPPTGNEQTQAVSTGAASTMSRGFRQARPEESSIVRMSPADARLAPDAVALPLRGPGIRFRVCRAPDPPAATLGSSGMLGSTDRWPHARCPALNQRWPSARFGSPWRPRATATQRERSRGGYHTSLRTP
jgi:hypothetical protein